MPHCKEPITVQLLLNDFNNKFFNLNKDTGIIYLERIANIQPGDYEAKLNIVFPSRDTHFVKVKARIYESCKVNRLTLSEKIMFVTYEMGGVVVLPEIVRLPKVSQEPECSEQPTLQRFEVSRIESLVPFEVVLDAIHIDNVSNTLTIAVTPDKIDIFKD